MELDLSHLSDDFTSEEFIQAKNGYDEFDIVKCRPKQWITLIQLTNNPLK